MFFGSVVSLAFGILVFWKYDTRCPLFLSLIIVSISLYPPLANLFFINLSRIVFYFFQTINLILLTSVFFLAITPLGIFFGLKGHRRQFFKIDAKTSYEVANPLWKIDFERLF